MAKKKGRKPTALCDGTSTTHKDYETLWLWLLNNAEARQVGPNRLTYYVVGKAQGELAKAVFEGHPSAVSRMRAVMRHMLNAKTLDGDPCTDFIPMKGRSQDRERRFCERQNHNDILLAFDEIDRTREWSGLMQGHRRRGTEAMHDRQRYLAQKADCETRGDFDGYRLASNAIEEIDTRGDVSKATLEAILGHFEGAV